MPRIAPADTPLLPSRRKTAARKERRGGDGERQKP
jgi:hypothetical protein